MDPVEAVYVRQLLYALQPKSMAGRVIFYLSIDNFQSGSIIYNYTTILSG